MNGMRSGAMVAVLGVSVICGASAAQSSSTSSDSTNGQARSARSSQQPNVHQVMRQFQGEWEGRLEVRNGEQLSVSTISTSNRFEDGKFVSVFEGFAFGEAFDGATMFGMDAKGQPEQYWWTTDFSKAGQAWSFQIGEDGNSIIARGTHHAGWDNTQFEHVMRPTDYGYEVEWFKMTPEGERDRIARMIVSRISRGERAEASELFEDGTFQSWNSLVKGARAEIVSD